MISKFISKTLRAVVAAGAIATLAPAASASEALGRTVLEVTMEGTQFARVSVSGAAIGGRPACHAAAFTVHYAFDISTSKGKAMLTALQSAVLSGKKVNVTGGSTCTSTGLNTIETLQILTLWST